MLEATHEGVVLPEVPRQPEDMEVVLMFGVEPHQDFPAVVVARVVDEDDLIGVAEVVKTPPRRAIRGGRDGALLLGGAAIEKSRLGPLATAIGVPFPPRRGARDRRGVGAAQ